jgi:hypothetical protein
MHRASQSGADVPGRNLTDKPRYGAYLVLVVSAANAGWEQQSTHQSSVGSAEMP